EISMSKKVALLLVLVFLTASCITAAKPALSSVTVAEDTWVSKAPMQVARGNLGVAVVNGKIYAIGGSTASGGGGTSNGPSPITGGVVGINEEYDPATDTWAFKTPMPTPRAVFAIAVYQNRIYCIGGYTSNGTVTGITEVYHPETNTWETGTSMPTPRGWLTANVASAKIYLIGGYVPDDSDFGFAISALNEVYDPETDSWATKAPIPAAIADYPSAVVGNKIYVMGGLSSRPQPDLNQIYDPETDRWSRGTLMPAGIRYGAAGATTGVNAPARIYFVSESCTQVYDPLNDSWAFGAIMPISRHGIAIAVANDILYVIGGFTQTYLDFPYSIPYGPSVTPYASNEQYTPFGFGAVPPVVAVLSPETKNYASGGVSLVFTVNKPVSWMGYSLDGQDNVTVAGNTTLAGLTAGLHNVTVYAKDEFENTGASETILFTATTEKEPETQPSPATVAAATAAFAAVAGIGLLIYFRKHKR
ncbi:MAG: hypothetical protein NWE94_01410, partial [Candidatus Bathyarchaeota archaeon]|nr:hypothetical protein [Candidatus Bathyarchaeota archaeon]